MGGKKGAEFPGTGATGNDENKDEETAAKQIQDAWNKDGTMWQSKSEPEATEAIKATGKKKTREKTAKKDELAPPGAVCSSEKQVVGKPVPGAHQHKKKNDKGKKGAEFPGTGATGNDGNKDEETAAKQIQDALNKDGTMWKSKSEPEATEAIKATGKNKTKEKTAKKDELAPPGAVGASERQDQHMKDQGLTATGPMI